MGPVPSEPSVSVPKLSAPLNGAKFRADPCTAFSPGQLKSLGFEVGKQTREQPGEVCSTLLGPVYWATANRETTGPQNIAELYRDHARGFYTGNHWEEVVIADYPAVLVTVMLDKTSLQDAGCVLALAVDESTLIRVGVSRYSGFEAGPRLPDLCAAVKKIAEVVVDNLRS